MTLALTFITGAEMLDAILMKPFHKYTNEPQRQLGRLVHSAGQTQQLWIILLASGLNLTSPETTGVMMTCDVSSSSYVGFLPNKNS